MTPTDTTHPPYRWVMLFGVWLVYMCYGMAVYSTGPLVDPIANDLGLSLGAMGTAMGAWPLLYIAMAIPSGALVDRIGVRPALLIATAIITIAVVLRSSAHGFALLFFAVALFGVGGPLVSVGVPKLISAWFEGKERGLAIGIYSAGPAMGAITALTLTNAVFMPMLDHSWRLTLLIYGGAAACAGLVWLAIVSRPQARLRDVPDTGGGTLAEQTQVFARLLGLGSVRYVLAIAVGIFMFNHALNNWLPEILRSGGMTPAQAGIWSAVPNLVGTIASLTLPRFASAERRMPTFLFVLACAAAATVLIAFASGATLLLGLVLQGVARGSMIPIATFALMETREVDSKVMGAAGGLFFTSAQVGGVFGPSMTGVLAQSTGGFVAPLLALTAVCAVCGVLVVLHERHIRRQLLDHVAA